MASISIASLASDLLPDAPLNSSILLVSLPTLAPDAFQASLANLAAAFPAQTVIIGTSGLPLGQIDLALPANLHLLAESTAAEAASGSWVLTASDYSNLFRLAQQHRATECLLLGSEAHVLTPTALRALADPLCAGADLAVAHYTLGPREGLVNSAILYPVSRAVFGIRPRFPLAVDLGLSCRMAERLAACALRFASSGQSDALLWPLNEAAIAGYTVAEVPVGPRAISVPAGLDLNTLLGQITGSLFADIDARAAFWQRSRPVQNISRTEPTEAAQPDETHTDPNTAPMVESFRLAYTNLADIWSLVLPPNSLLGLKRLSQSPADAFRMPDALWARIVYDFLLAFRLRTINRGHLLGALTPLYLAWVASHLLLTASGTAPERHIEQQAQAFEFDKPYLVSRWRWPDRFNP